MMKVNLDKVNKLHANKFGIAFTEKADDSLEKKINILFNNTVLTFNEVELNIFLQDIENTLSFSSPGSGKYTRYYKSNILETPVYQLRYVMSYNDLELIKDLVKGTLFQIELSGMLQELL